MTQIEKIKRAFERGATTANDAAKISRLPAKTARARTTELRRLGAIVPTGDTIKTAGRRLVVYRLA